VRRELPHSEKFDPNLHQAMFEVPDATVAAGSVVQVVQPGYMIGERVLRPALVGVSKGGPRAAPVSLTNDNAKTAKESAAKES
jgi:molecular chaperone GrpE